MSMATDTVIIVFILNPLNILLILYYFQFIAQTVGLVQKQQQK